MQSPNLVWYMVVASDSIHIENDYTNISLILVETS